MLAHAGLRADLQGRLELYRAGQAYVQPQPGGEAPAGPEGPAASSEKASAALSVTGDVGWNTTETAHVRPTASVLPQVFVLIVNSAAFVPVRAIPLRLSVAVPPLIVAELTAAWAGKAITPKLASVAPTVAKMS